MSNNPAITITQTNFQQPCLRFRFCEDPPDDRHAWTLAVARDGTQHLQLKNAVEQDPKIPTPSVIGHSPFKKVFASEEAKNFPQVNGFARKSSSESRDSALASSPPNLTSKSEDSMIKFKEVSETVIVQKLKTHSEKSSSAEQVQEKIEGRVTRLIFCRFKLIFL